VQDVILEAPAGLEEYPREVTYAPGKKALLFDPSFARDFEKWKQAWDQTGILANEMARTEQGVRDFFYIKKRDPVTGAVSQNPNGYFMNDSEYARFHTDQRIGLIKGNPKGRQRPSASGQGLHQLFDASACARHVACA